MNFLLLACFMAKAVTCNQGNLLKGGGLDFFRDSYVHYRPERDTEGVGSRGGQNQSQANSSDRFTTDLTIDFLPIIDENLW